MTDIAMTISIAEEANAPSVGNNRVCSDGRDRENKCSGSQRTRVEVRTGCRGSS